MEQKGLIWFALKLSIPQFYIFIFLNPFISGLSAVREVKSTENNIHIVYSQSNMILNSYLFQKKTMKIHSYQSNNLKMKAIKCNLD